jgi:uncharacterized membrane protein
MALLVLGLVIFIAIHFFPALQSQRAALIERLGELKYKSLFSLASLASFALILLGKANAPFIEVWQPPHLLAVVTKLLMLPAMILLVAAYFPSNFKRKIRHPMLIAVKIWAFAHLLINGDLASMILFGSFLGFAVLAMISANKRMEWTKPNEQSVLMDVLVILIGGAIYAGAGMYHLQLFGVSIFGAPII